MEKIVYDYAVYANYKVGHANYRACMHPHVRYRTCHGKRELSITLAEILLNDDILDAFYYICQPVDREPTLFDWSPNPNDFELTDIDNFIDD